MNLLYIIMKYLQGGEGAGELDAQNRLCLEP